MKNLRICFATSELAPFVKAGGLGDVSAALPAQLVRQGHDVRVFVPLYSRIDTSEGFSPIPELAGIDVTIGPTTYRFSVFKARLPGSELDIHFIHCPALYGRPDLYSQDPDEHRRFLLLSRAAIESCQRMQWAPDIFHCHDWQTALIPLFLKTVYAWDQLFENSRTVFTIHNMGYQGTFPSSVLNDLNLGESASLLDQADLKAGRINFLKTGLTHATWLTTVSPTYASEIQGPDQGMGLDGILRMRSGSLTGILNGVDYQNWSPETDPFIPHQYSAKSLWRKELNKEALLEALDLPYTKGIPVAGIVSRLAHQKGLDLLFETIPYLLSHHDFRFVLLGSGEPRYEEFFGGLQARFPRQVCFYSGYNEKLAHLIEAGSDMFLMPSRYEPCGLNQMYSLKYGTVPIVRNTGGLADTVRLYNPDTRDGNGFVFDHFTVEGLQWALEFALGTYQDRRAWQRIMLNGMAEDFSWDVQGRRYEELYQRVLEESRG